MEAALLRTLATHRRDGATAEDEGCQEVRGRTPVEERFLFLVGQERLEQVCQLSVRRHLRGQLTGQLWDHLDLSLPRIAL